MSKNRSVYPIYLTELNQVVTVVVGGGPIAERKIEALLAGGAQIHLIAPTITPQLQVWATAEQIIWLARPYEPGDLASAFLAFAVTDQRQVNAAVAAEARRRGILCNVADRAEEGNFHTPATLRLRDQDASDIDKGEPVPDTAATEFMFALGSNGKHPKRVKQLRDWLRVQWATRPADNSD